LKVVILAGGFGTRLTEETELRPKPLIEIGGKPILWHVMKIFEAGGYSDFVICCGYKGQLIKSYFVNYFTENYDIMVNLDRHSVEFLGQPSEKWRVTLVDTGLDTLTGGRIKRIAPYVADETFCLTYGDGVARLDIGEVVRFHRKHGRKATVTAVPAPGRFGVLELADNGNVQSFREKPDNEIGWINGGFFVCEPSVFDYIEGDATSWERTPLERLARDGELMAYQHTGFWKPMDTLRDKRELEEFWANGKAPWKIW
jgi:glucose-1-phosphate cytidylyltransferase